MSLARRLVCAFVGHAMTDWAEVTWVAETYSWVGPMVDWLTTSNGRQESRFCLRCHSAYEQRWAIR